MDPDSLSQLALILFFLMLSAFFSASETALLAINKIKLTSMVDQKVKGAKRVARITDKPDKLLSSILVCNNLANISISTLATAFAISYAENSSYVLMLTTVLVTVVLLIVGEITPKTLAARYPERISLKVSGIVSATVFIMTPVVGIINFLTRFFMSLFESDAESGVTLTETEIKTMVDMSHKEGVIETEEKIMINNVFEFGDNTAKDIMTPRTDIVSVCSSSGHDEIMELFKNERYSRILVYKEDIDHVIGILFFKDFIFSQIPEADFCAEKLLRPVFFSYENKPISKLFSEMRQAGIPIAVILDEYGGTSGIVTIEDLVEEIVGDISDEDDIGDKDYEIIGDGEYLVDGGMKIDDFNEIAGTVFESEDYESIGGYVLGALNHIPDRAEEYTETGALFVTRFIIEEMDKQRIDKLRIIVSENSEAGDGMSDGE